VHKDRRSKTNVFERPANGTATYNGKRRLRDRRIAKHSDRRCRDSVGTLYIADLGNCRIRKVTPGVITTVAGNGTNGFSGDGGFSLSFVVYVAST
jgi:trimeric autotransporter adhesin